MYDRVVCAWANVWGGGVKALAWLGVACVCVVIASAVPNIVADDDISPALVYYELARIRPEYWNATSWIFIRHYCGNSNVIAWAWYEVHSIQICADKSYNVETFPWVLRHEMGHLYAYVNGLYFNTSYDDRERIATWIGEEMGT